MLKAIKNLFIVLINMTFVALQTKHGIQMTQKWTFYMTSTITSRNRTTRHTSPIIAFIWTLLRSSKVRQALLFEWKAPLKSIALTFTDKIAWLINYIFHGKFIFFCTPLFNKLLLQPVLSFFTFLFFYLFCHHLARFFSIFFVFCLFPFALFDFKKIPDIVRSN